MEFYEKKSYNLKAGTDEALRKFAERYPDLYDNKSHVVRCAIISFFREQRKQGRYINEAIQ